MGLEGKTKRILTKFEANPYTFASLDTPPSRDPLEFYIDRGDASQEVIEEVLNALNNLHLTAGGFGYNMQITGAYEVIAEEDVEEPRIEEDDEEDETQW